MKTKSMIWLVVVMLLTFQLSSCSEHIDDEWHGTLHLVVFYYQTIRLFQESPSTQQK